MAGEPDRSRRWEWVAGIVLLIVIGAWVVITRIARFRDPWGVPSPEAADLGLRDASVTAADGRETAPAAVEDSGGGRTRQDGAVSIDHTVRDRAMHDDVRARILAAWSAARSATPDAGAGGATDDQGPPGGRLDATYIRSLIRDEFLPMARDCYDQQLARADAAAGRMTLQFVIMADQHAGGIVDDVQSDAADGGSFDEAFGTCMRETMRTMVFRAPEGGGRVTVRYPFAFAHGDGG